MKTLTAVVVAATLIASHAALSAQTTPIATCGQFFDNIFPPCLVFQPFICNDYYILDNYGTSAVGDVVFVQGDVVPGCPNSCIPNFSCVLNTVITSCPPYSGPDFVECGTIVPSPIDPSCLVFEASNGDLYNLDTVGAFQVGAEVLVAGDLDPCCTYVLFTCAFISCVLNNTIEACPAAAPSFLRGDCNDDAGADIADAIFLLSNLFGSPQPVACADACDANDDGTINIADAIALLSGLFQALPLPAPWQICGTDGTASGLTCDAPTSCP